ncbi:MAG TPA: ACP S-malonyltransferase [Firmicutes bacterium]|nr:ACP S-malonyltransferase [Candidatus Fermentithermobacillaceae bacterium]
MSKTAWVFPGQGAQVVGMGKDMCEAYPAARKIFETADEVLGFSLSGLIFEGPDEKLSLTENAQPALLAVGVAGATVLREHDLEPDMTAGLSLGEYTALVIAGSLRFEDAVYLTHKRGVYMQEACPPGEGAMAAVLGIGPGDVDAVCEKARAFGEVTGANYNCPGQIVISGKKAAVQEASRLAKELGARVIPLNVSAPFHCSLMESAALKLRAILDKVEVRPPSIPVYSNVHGERLVSASDVREALIAQVTMPVFWQKDIEAMERDGARLFVEIGAGKTLQGFGKRTHPHIPYVRFETPSDLADVVALTKEALLR